MLHHRAFGPKCGQRHAAADHFTQHRHVRLKPRNVAGINRLRSTQGHPAAGHHLIKYQQGTRLAAQLAAALHEGHTGPHEVHVSRNWLDHQAGHFRAVQFEGLFELLDVVVLQHQGVRHHLRRHTGAGGVAKSGQARSGLDQQSVGVAVITPFKFDDFAAPGGTARQTYGTHPRLRTAADQAHHVQAGVKLQDGFDQFHLAFGGCPKREPIAGGGGNGLDHGRVPMPQNHRAPGADVIGVLLPVGIPHVGALRTRNKTGRATNGLEGTHGGIHTAWNHLLGAVKQADVTIGCKRDGGVHVGFEVN